MVLEKSENKSSLLGFQYEPEYSDVHKVCFAKEQDIPRTLEESTKNRVILFQMWILDFLTLEIVFFVNLFSG